MKGEIDKCTVAVGDITLISVTDRANRKSVQI